MVKPPGCPPGTQHGSSGLRALPPGSHSVIRWTSFLDLTRMGPLSPWWQPVRMTTARKVWALPDCRVGSFHDEHGMARQGEARASLSPSSVGPRYIRILVYDVYMHPPVGTSLLAVPGRWYASSVFL